MAAPVNTAEGGTCFGASGFLLNASPGWKSMTTYPSRHAAKTDNDFCQRRNLRCI